MDRIIVVAEVVVGVGDSHVGCAGDGGVLRAGRGGRACGGGRQ